MRTATSAFGGAASSSPSPSPPSSAPRWLRRNIRRRRFGAGSIVVRSRRDRVAGRARRSIIYTTGRYAGSGPSGSASACRSRSPSEAWQYTIHVSRWCPRSTGKSTSSRKVSPSSLSGLRCDVMHSTPPGSRTRMASPSSSRTRLSPPLPEMSASMVPLSMTALNAPSAKVMARASMHAYSTPSPAQSRFRASTTDAAKSMATARAVARALSAAAPAKAGASGASPQPTSRSRSGARGARCISSSGRSSSKEKYHSCFTPAA
mmetsp:Transcript_19449/g.58777  ORF Transcript_19449/g.58777 Transcript_19449/m.58777 type:complete len:262 (+) Transcript_19449:39-824(+)